MANRWAWADTPTGITNYTCDFLVQLTCEKAWNGEYSSAPQCVASRKCKHYVANFRWQLHLALPGYLISTATGGKWAEQGGKVNVLSTAHCPRVLTNIYAIRVATSVYHISLIFRSIFVRFSAFERLARRKRSAEKVATQLGKMRSQLCFNVTSGEPKRKNT